MCLTTDRVSFLVNDAENKEHCIKEQRTDLYKLSVDSPVNVCPVTSLDYQSAMVKVPA